jgi:hypothetical protein
MRRPAAILAAVVVGAVGAVILGEYDLEGTTAIIGFPLFALAITEIAVAVAGALRWALPVVAVVVAGALTWALWISFNHFRREQPPVLSWAMVVVAVVVCLAWGRSGRRTRSEVLAGEQGAVAGGEHQQQQP